MKLARAAAFGLAVLALGACGSKFKTYDGPEVTRVLVFKDSRQMYLMHHDVALKAYQIDLGFAPEGHKQFSGDGRTPEGDYVIDKRNPESSYHLSIGINYPRPQDVEVARALGLSPGNNIFIHGEPDEFSDSADWTAGCIAISNDEIEDVYAMVPNGTPVTISP